MLFGESTKPTWLKIMECEPLPEEVVEEHAFNHDDCSKNLELTNKCPLRVSRFPVAQVTDGIRGKVGYTHGVHVWEFTWPKNQRGTHATVGVATRNERLWADGYISLIGMSDQSWGLDLTTNRLYHDAKREGKGGRLYMHTDEVIPDRFHMVLDTDERTLSFVVAGRHRGVAFDLGSHGGALYPMIGMVWGHAKVSMCYVGGHVGPKSLQDQCRRFILRNMARTPTQETIEVLPLPKAVKEYIVDGFLYYKPHSQDSQYDSDSRTKHPADMEVSRTTRNCVLRSQSGINRPATVQFRNV